MNEICIYGASDDLVEVTGAIDEEFSQPKGTWHGVLSADGQRLGVWLRYGRTGTWAVGVYQMDEDEPIPDWPISIRQGTASECAYSVTLVVDAPDGAELAEVES